MEFWRLRYKVLVDDGYYDKIEAREELFFEDIEQAMAYVLDVKETEDIESFEIKKCGLAIYKKKYILNNDGEED